MASGERRTVLLVDPDAAAARELAAVLETRYRVAIVHTATAARAWLAAAAPAAPDAVVFELALPDADGLLFCAELQSRTSAPLLVFTSQSTGRELLLSLRLGADDFVAKPAPPEEIEARIGALLRRAARARDRAALPPSPARPSPPGQRLGDLVIDRDRLTATLAGRPLYLTQTEFRLLSAFVRHVNEPLSRRELARLAGDDEYVAGTRSLDMHVRRLRAKLRGAPGSPGNLSERSDRVAWGEAQGRVPAIVAVRGYGYRMVYRETAGETGIAGTPASGRPPAA